MDSANPFGQFAKFWIVMSARGSGLILVEMDHFMSHGGEQKIGGMHQARRDSNLAEAVIATRLSVATAKVANPVLCAEHAEHDMVGMRQSQRQKGGLTRRYSYAPSSISGVRVRPGIWELTRRLKP